MRKTIAALLLTASLAAPTPVAGAAPTGTLTLTGGRSAHVELTFATRFKPDVGVFGRSKVSVSTGGTYAGVFFENVRDPNLGLGAVLVPKMTGYGGPEAVGWGSSDRDDFSLPAGRYRVHLLATAQAVVKVPVAGLARSVTVSPRKASLVNGTLVSVDAARAEVPVTVRPTTTTVMLGSTYSDLAIATTVSICLDQHNGRPCEVANGLGMNVFYVTPSPEASTTSSFFVYPGQASSGEHTANFTIAHAGAARGIYAFALTLN